METEKFRKGVERLVGLANKTGPAAIMCAEATWWRCHRALIPDYPKAPRFDVMYILDLAKTEPHPFTPAARLVNGELSYMANDSLLARATTKLWNGFVGKLRARFRDGKIHKCATPDSYSFSSQSFVQMPF